MVKNTICLVMIVKNEGHVIKKCLQSVLPYVSTYVICDNGSTDNTEAVVKECLGDHVVGEFIHTTWRDFSSNRNEAILHARDKAEYLLFMDADDWLQVDNEQELINLTEDVYDVEFHQNNVRYWRPCIVRESLHAKYIGILHEYLELPPTAKKKELRGAHIMYGATGSRSRNPNKYLDDAMVFEKELRTNPSPRNVFYYAESLKNAGCHEQAIFQYWRRYRMNDWIEERYVAILNAAQLYAQRNPSDMVNIEDMFLKAHTTIPSRSEALYYLALYMREQKNFEKGYVFSKLGLNLKPCTGLFIQEDIVQWKMKDECAVNCYWIHNKEEGKILNQELLSSPYLPSDERSRIIDNLRFCSS